MSTVSFSKNRTCGKEIPEHTPHPAAEISVFFRTPGFSCLAISKGSALKQKKGYPCSDILFSGGKV